MSNGRRYGDRVLYRRLGGEIRPYAWHVAALFALSILAAPLALLTPVPLKIAVDSLVGSHPAPGFLDAMLPAAATERGTALLLTTALLLLLIALLTQLQTLGTEVLRTYTGERLALAFRTRLFRHMQRLSTSYHDAAGTSDSTYRIQYDALSIQHIATDTIISFVTATCTVAGMLYVTARIDTALALVALAVAPVLVLLSASYRPRLRRQSRHVKRLESGGMGVVQEALEGARVVKAFGQEEREEQRFVRRFSEGMWARVRYTLASNGYALFVGLTTGVGTAAVLYVGVRQVQAGRITLGELVLVMAYMTQLYGPLRTMSKKAGSLQRHLAGAERAFALLDEAPDVPERADARPLRRARGAVAFEIVTFAYGRGRPVLRDLSFEVEAGTRLGIAGATGAGKTTLVSLLNRFYDPTAGRILLDGVDLRDYRLADLRRQFAVVLQEPMLFSTTIGENIAYARPDASYRQIAQAARAAGVHDAIGALPDGYDTLVGERGMRLSGGERQRISIARAFLTDAPILILDEPTSAVDVDTERAIMEAMLRLMEGRTTFLIAHRATALAHCEVRMRLEEGRIGALSQARSAEQAASAGALASPG